MLRTSCRSPSVAMKSSGGVALDVLLDAGQRLLRHRAAVRQRDAEELEPERRPRRRAREIEEADAFGGDLEVAADVARDAHAGLRNRRPPHAGERPRRARARGGSTRPSALPRAAATAGPRSRTSRRPSPAARGVSTFTSRLLSRCRTERTRWKNSSASCSWRAARSSSASAPPGLSSRMCRVAAMSRSPPGALLMSGSSW